MTESHGSHIPETYRVQRIPAKQAMTYIRANHYSHGSHNGPSPCYGLFDSEDLIGVLMFATPCSENVRASVYGKDRVNEVKELHRLHILDVTPKNTESWFIARCFRLLQQDRPDITAILSFADATEGHKGVIYQATNAYRLGTTGKATFYLDTEGRLRHPRQSGVNISKAVAIERGWTPVKRDAKTRYLWLLGSRTARKHLLHDCLLLTPSSA